MKTRLLVILAIVFWSLSLHQPAGGFGDPQGETMPQIILDDFLVNDDTTGGCDQLIPAIAQNPLGNSVITWVDGRSVYQDVYAQRYDPSGTPLDFNFKVTEISLGVVFSPGLAEPTVAIDNSGNFVITWIDPRNDEIGGDVYAQRYNSSGLPLGSNFVVNDDAGDSEQRYPATGMDDSGNFVIVWQDDRNDNNGIFAQRYNFSGIPLGSNFKINDDAGASSQSRPAVAMDGSGNFVIVWMDERNDNYDIYAQRYDSLGTPLESNFKVNDDGGSASQGFPAISVDESGNFVIVWRDDRNDNHDIFAQRYNFSGIPLGSNFKVNDDTGASSQSLPAVAMDRSGNFVISWDDKRNDNYDIYAQRYDSSGAPLESNFKVNDDAETASQRYSAIGANASGNFAITWEDKRNVNRDIYAQRYDSLGTPLESNFKVNDDGGSASQMFPAISVDESGNFVITWEDKRNDNWDIYAQRHDSSGIPLGSNFKVNDDTGTAYQERPDVAIDGNGNFVITWQDNRDYPTDIYAQRYNFSGTPLRL